MSQAHPAAVASAPAPSLGSLPQRALATGVVGLVLCLVGAVSSPEQFYRSYLVGYLYWIGIALGCLPLMMIHHLTGGAWGLVTRRIFEAGARTLVLMVPLFLPILIGLPVLYLWARPEAVAVDEILQHKSPYLNAPFFLFRAGVYFAVWVFIAWRFSRWSEQQDATGDREVDQSLARKMELFSGPAAAAYGLTVTFAAIDWLMSLDPHWYSTIFGALWAVGQLLGALAFSISVLVVLSDQKPLSEVIRPDIYQDLGKLLLAFVMVWAYFSFSQFLIIWSGNLVEEIPWYLHRSHGGWQLLALALILFQFALPFVLLLSRQLKRTGPLLRVVAAVVLVMQFVNLFWVIAPNFHQEALHFHWLDVAAPLGIGGIWLWTFFGHLTARPVLPLHDPYIHEALFDERGHH
jgi:hypothetical protein